MAEINPNNINISGAGGNVDGSSASENGQLTAYMTPLGAWALSVGTAIGWGSMFVTSNTYLIQAGPLGTALGLIIGALIMLIISKNYHYMINAFPDAGGAYTYAKDVFGYDHGFVTAWFLALTYLSIFWANVTSLPLFSRYFFGDIFKTGYMYTLFGSYDVYLGEVLLSISAIGLFAALSIYSKRMSIGILTGSVLLFSLVIVVITIVSMVRMGTFHRSFNPGFVPDSNEISQIIKIASISPWAFIGFENISHSTEEFSFSRGRSFRILTLAVIASTVLYVMITVLSVTAYPSEYNTWFDYMLNHGNLSGLRGLPAFYAANYYMGNTGVHLLMLALLAIIVSSLIGNMLAMSRLMYALARDNILPARFARLNRDGNPERAILLMAGVSALIPLIGRTAVGWIVDVTTIGATIVYAIVSATSYKLAVTRSDAHEKVFGMAGMVLMSLFLLIILVPSILGTGNLASETYFLFTVWAMLGFIYFRSILRRDTLRRFGRTIIVWTALLGMIMFTTLVWMSEESITTLESSITNVRGVYVDKMVKDARVIDALRTGDPWSEVKKRTNEKSLSIALENQKFEQELQNVRAANSHRMRTVFILLLLSIGALLNNYSVVIRRADKSEAELGAEREKSGTDPLTGVKNKRRFNELEANADQKIKDGICEDFSVVVADLNGLKYINDNFGHKAGDDYIKTACKMICDVFDHSPVYRIGGDEFVAILKGQDRDRRHELMAVLDSRSTKNIGTDRGPVIACGLSDYIRGEDEDFRTVFNRSDHAMYIRKDQLKELGSKSR